MTPLGDIKEVRGEEQGSPLEDSTKKTIDKNLLGSDTQECCVIVVTNQFKYTYS